MVILLIVLGIENFSLWCKIWNVALRIGDNLFGFFQTFEGELFEVISCIDHLIELLLIMSILLFNLMYFIRDIFELNLHFLQPVPFMLLPSHNLPMILGLNRSILILSHVNYTIYAKILYKFNIRPSYNLLTIWWYNIALFIWNWLFLKLFFSINFI